MKKRKKIERKKKNKTRNCEHVISALHMIEELMYRNT